MKVAPDECLALRRIVFDQSRDLPVVLINGDPNPVTFQLVPDEIQRRLIGSCYVIWAPPAAGWGAAWRAHFPVGYSSRPNSVRIYQPHADVDRPGDSYRHRFFSEDDIRAHGGVDAFVHMVRDGLTRRLLIPYVGRIATCEDVMRLRAEEDFRAQRASLTSRDEELELYGKEYSRVLDQIKLADQLIAESDAEKKALSDELAGLRPHARAIADQLEQLKRERSTSTCLQSHVDLLRKILDGSASVLDCLQALAVVQPEAVLVLPSAFKSAESVKRFEHINELRSALVTLATKYRDALMDRKSDQEAWRVFGRNDIASRESDNLSKEGRLARTFEVDGRPVLMQQHLKIGVKDSEAHCIRIHFMWDAQMRRVIIGHCGRHLPL